MRCSANGWCGDAGAASASVSASAAAAWVRVLGLPSGRGAWNCGDAFGGNLAARSAARREDARGVSVDCGEYVGSVQTGNVFRGLVAGLARRLTTPDWLRIRGRRSGDEMILSTIRGPKPGEDTGDACGAFT
jgi:hypothetical protein